MKDNKDTDIIFQANYVHSKRRGARKSHTSTLKGKKNDQENVSLKNKTNKTTTIQF